VEVKIVKSSGNAAFDRQAELAVQKASPLSVPEDPRLFRRLAQIIFEFKPGG
jgi:colicin import membrane protein